MAYHNATWEEHLDASERILRWMITHNGDKPNYVTIAGEKFTPAEYEDANKRVQKWIDDPANKGKPKPKVRYGVASQPVWDGVISARINETTKDPRRLEDDNVGIGNYQTGFIEDRYKSAGMIELE